MQQPTTPLAYILSLTATEKEQALSELMAINFVSATEGLFDTDGTGQSHGRVVGLAVFYLFSIFAEHFSTHLGTEDTTESLVYLSNLVSEGIVNGLVKHYTDTAEIREILKSKGIGLN
jgi:hypothetical protein|tara:strand:+ start:72 stop:425 length:354 start_codon:yes stop_codon:yes gene_type:complete